MEPLLVLMKNCFYLTLGLGIWCGFWTVIGRKAKDKDNTDVLNFAWLMGGFPALLSIYAYIVLIMHFSEAVKRTLQ